MTFHVEHVTLTIMAVLTILICLTDSKILVTSRGTKNLVDIFHDEMLFGRGKFNWADNTVKNYLIHADPPHACYDVKPPPTLQFEATGRDSAKIVSAQVKWILLVSDSDCGLIEKEIFAKKAGYSAIIIYNERTNEPRMMAHEHFLQLNDHLGVSFVGENDGYILKHDYTYPKRYTITFEENPERVPRKSYHQPRTQNEFTQNQTASPKAGVCSGNTVKECIWEVAEIIVLFIGLICCFLPFLLCAIGLIQHGIAWFSIMRAGAQEIPVPRNRIRNPSNVDRVDLDGGVSRLEIIDEDDDEEIRREGLIIRRLVAAFSNPTIVPRIPMPELESVTFISTDADFNCKLCVICLDGFNDSEELSRLPCTHYFHKTCIRDWFERSTSHDCPLCRTAATDTSFEEVRALSDLQDYFRELRPTPED